MLRERRTAMLDPCERRTAMLGPCERRTAMLGGTRSLRDMTLEGSLKDMTPDDSTRVRETSILAGIDLSL